MKTSAIQQVMIKLEKLHPNLFDIYTEKGRQFVNHFHKYLDIEKQQILDAYKSGINCISDADADFYYTINYKPFYPEK